MPTIAAGSHSLKIVLWSHFVPAYDTWFDKWAKDWGSSNKVDVTVDHIPTNTVPTRMSAEVSANSGHDLVQFQNGSDVHVFSDKLNDVTDLSGYLASKYGGWAEVAKDAAVVNGAWKGVPQYLIRFPSMYRKDLFDQEGLQAPKVWEDLINVGEKLKPKGHPVGFAISQTGDSNSTLYSILWSYGGSVTGKDGKTITIKSDGTKAALEAVQKIFKAGMTNEVLSWDDSSNNRYLASGVACYILNPISAYRSAPQDIQDKTAIALTPAGPAGDFVNCPIYTWAIPTWTKEKPAAEKFLVDFYADWKAGFEASTGYNHPLLLDMTKKPMPVLGADPKLQVLQDFLPLARTIGYPGPATAAAGQVNNTYVIPNMFAKAVTGSSADDAMAWAEEQIKAVYDKYPTT
ncbi:MAG TPA: extracellular solute-binding protein [Nitrolancea sp.]|nr:extracellular solute-binding protein [Nitrolancea sp.]